MNANKNICVQANIKKRKGNQNIKIYKKMYIDIGRNVNKTKNEDVNM